ncbi:type II toxin-antitoxin system HicA family toxin [Aquirufa ecclesiirivi]|uniref:type II toxin-antitoxin system HicA family toxin n=1 Tax=Aquirufa ecclesiirivi TaxID=2715124 RepID=UPI0023D7FB9D|nr:type II toxin-antitoxin system HicA family toxin [Aquirufa ecclesiirivi]MDF0693000.1 type II toxin-antitoxin system HicA family toxin [Aquirufa ecclesiirivi]
MASVNELLKILKNDGWYLYRNGANHDLYRHPIKLGQLVIPRHASKEMANGTWASILKAAGLNRR